MPLPTTVATSTSISPVAGLYAVTAPRIKFPASKTITADCPTDHASPASTTKDFTPVPMVRLVVDEVEYLSPSSPEKPLRPEKPLVPLKPEVPENPEKPDVPEKPLVPLQPLRPDCPLVP